MSVENLQQNTIQEENIVQDVDFVEEGQQEQAEEEVVYGSQITIYGNPDSYNWVGGDNGELHVSFCTFNTKIGETTYKTNVGIKEDGTPIAVISYNEEITVDVVNFIVNHIMLIACQCATTNDQLFYTRTEEGTMDANQYNPLSPVLQMVTVLHSWANIARFQTVNDGQVQQAVEVQE